METSTMLELTVDLGLWKEGQEVTVEVPASVTVGHVADQLALFVGLPQHDEDEKRVPYSLRPVDDEDRQSDQPAADAGREGQSEALDTAEIVGDVIGELQRIRNRERSMLDRELTVLAAGISGPVALEAESVPYVDQLMSTYERKIKGAIDTEVERWLQKGRTLVIGTLSDAMNEIRNDIRERIAPLIPSGLRGVVAQYRAGKALRNFGQVRAEAAYTDAVRSGLRLAGKSAGSVLGFAGNAAASTAAGGLAGSAAGATAGAVAATTVLLITGGVGLLGADGEMGERGQVGPPGEQGDQGEKGDPGETGATGLAGTVWSVGLDSPSEETAGDFHLDRCTGVISHRNDGEWIEVVDLAATQGRAVASACDNLEIVTPGQSLWAVVGRRCRDADGNRLTNREISRAVAQTWVANLDIVGPSANSVDTDQPLVLRCS